jgi:hypothetical protein
MKTLTLLGQAFNRKFSTQPKLGAPMFPNPELQAAIDKLRESQPAASDNPTRDMQGVEEELELAWRGSSGNTGAAPARSKSTDSIKSTDSLDSASGPSRDRSQDQRTKKLELEVTTLKQTQQNLTEQQRLDEQRRKDNEARLIRELERVEAQRLKELEQAKKERAELEKQRKQEAIQSHDRHTQLLQDQFRSFMSMGNTYASTQQHQLGLVEYQRAKGIVVALNEHYRKRPGQEFVSSFQHIDHYKELNDECDLAIANCHISLRDHRKAYAELKALDIKYLSPLYTTKQKLLEQCKAALLFDAKLQLESAMAIDLREDEHARIWAATKLAAVKEIYDLLSLKYPDGYVLIENKINWYRQQHNINQRVNGALATQFPLTDYGPIYIEIRFLLDTYTRYREFLNAEESDNFHALEQLNARVIPELNAQRERERLETERKHDIAAQRSINTSLQTIRELLQDGNIPAAYEMLQNAQGRAARFYNPNNILRYQPAKFEAVLHYTPVEYFDAPLQELHAELQHFNQRVQNNAPALSAVIIKRVLSSIAAERTALQQQQFSATLLEPHLKVLQQTLLELLTTHWHKFDRRASEVCDAMVNTIVNTIKMHIKDIGLINRLWHWSNATLV